LFFRLFESATIQFPRALIALLIVLASASLIPSLPDLDTLSDPAKSTIVIRALFMSALLDGLDFHVFFEVVVHAVDIFYPPLLYEHL